MKMARQLALQLKSAVTDSLTSAQKECSDCKHPEFVSLVDFNKQMSAKLLEELARVSSKATDAIDNARDCIEKLNLPADYFPQMEGAKTAVRNALTCMATATGARILASKAAARKKCISQVKRSRLLEILPRSIAGNSSILASAIE